MAQLVAEVRRELVDHIIPFWKGLRDDLGGGYIGLVDFDLARHPEADKGCILNSRILWFFSEAYRTLGNASLLDEARHAYEMLKRMTDATHGGVFWALRADGAVADATKHTYNQGFAIYALAAYYRASGDAEALARAKALFDVVETHCRDANGYLEAFTADWQPESNEKLSENGVMASRTMNTLLHVMEGYTGLYEADRDPVVREKLYEILGILEAHIWNPVKRRQEVFFDLDYNTLIDLYSYGHDIETSWLADHTLDALGDEALTARIRPMLLAMADQTYADALTDHGFANECERGVVDAKRTWWVQAEALLGFLNAWERTGEARYRDAARSQWRYIKGAMIDPREGSEWYAYLTEAGEPLRLPVVDPWKCPYHNGRMALEVIRRAPEIEV
ncbi:MAG: AGE family epimerase/isomerase [Clostridia bacterium]|nr:AGE family epimerase/isomerase [Clostridia bacterium]